MKIRRMYFSALAIAALYSFALVNNSDAQSLCDFDCEGSTRCTLEINGVEVVVGGVNFIDGSDPEDVDDTEKEVQILCKDLSWKQGNRRGQAKNDPDKRSTIRIKSLDPNGDPFYPAAVEVTSYMVVTIDDVKFTSNDPLVLRSTERVRSWPMEEAVTYKLTEDVTYVDDNNRKLTFKAGSTATMKGA